MHTPHRTPQAISYRNHQKSLAYFSHLAQLILFISTKRQSQKEGKHGTMHSPKYALVSTFRPTKVLMAMVNFQKKVFVVRDESPYSSEPCLAYW